MTRAKRHYLPGYIWHITHRCHRGEYLLKFARDRRRWIEWLYRAKKRYQGLSVLNYMVTSNHIHLIVSDSEGQNVIPDSIKLVAGRTAQEYNQRKQRKGAFWEDRYHATAVDSNRYLRQCITYIDLNMVRAGVVEHPSEWEFCGFNEIQRPKRRKRILDMDKLVQLLGFENHAGLKEAHYNWVNSGLMKKATEREIRWTKSIAVGGKSYVETIKGALGFKVKGRKVRKSKNSFELREKEKNFSQEETIEPNNKFDWQ